MPTYVYACPSCAAVTEQFRWYSQAADPPPQCAPCGVAMERRITGGTRTVIGSDKGGTGAGKDAGRYDR